MGTDPNDITIQLTFTVMGTDPNDKKIQLTLFASKSWCKLTKTAIANKTKKTKEYSTKELSKTKKYI